jgi:hypothetical protein
MSELNNSSKFREYRKFSVILPIIKSMQGKIRIFFLQFRWLSFSWHLIKVSDHDLPGGLEIRSSPPNPDTFSTIYSQLVFLTVPVHNYSSESFSFVKSFLLYRLCQIFPVPTKICENVNLTSENWDWSSFVFGVIFDEFARKLSSRNKIQHEHWNDNSFIKKSNNSDWETDFNHHSHFSTFFRIKMIEWIFVTNLLLKMWMISTIFEVMLNFPCSLSFSSTQNMFIAIKSFTLGKCSSNISWDKSTSIKQSISVNNAERKIRILGKYLRQWWSTKVLWKGRFAWELEKWSNVPVEIVTVESILMRMTEDAVFSVPRRWIV